MDWLQRREFITLLGGATAWSLSARAQQGRLARIGALVLTTADAESLGKDIREGLRELGYVEGRNFTLELRSAEGSADRLPDLAAELVRLQVDVIVAAYRPASRRPSAPRQRFRLSWRRLPIRSARGWCKAWRSRGET